MPFLSDMLDQSRRQQDEEQALARRISPRRVCSRPT